MTKQCDEGGGGSAHTQLCYERVSLHGGGEERERFECGADVFLGELLSSPTTQESSSSGAMLTGV